MEVRILDKELIQNISLVVSSILSILAFIISVGNFLIERRKVVTESIAINRMEWIKDVRKLMMDFLNAYLQKQSKDKLQILRMRIDLYTRIDSEAYERLNEQLDHCINNPFSIENYNLLLLECQRVLNSVWRRMKLESGINDKRDKKIQKLIRKMEQDVIKE